jgi:hypothetical protein
MACGMCRTTRLSAERRLMGEGVVAILDEKRRRSTLQTVFTRCVPSAPRWRGLTDGAMLPRDTLRNAGSEWGVVVPDVLCAAGHLRRLTRASSWQSSRCGASRIL